MITVDSTFIVDSDIKADWAVNAIKEAEEERDRLIMLAEAKIEQLQEQIADIKARCDRENAYLYSMLDEYMSGCKVRETKTQSTYKLLSGTLVRKKEQHNIVKPEGEAMKSLIEFVRVSYPELIKSTYTEAVDWAVLKKHLKTGDGVVTTDDGELVECLTVEDVPESFSIK